MWWVKQLLYTQSAHSVYLIDLLLELTVMPPCVYLLVTDLMTDGLRGMFCGNVNVWVWRPRELYLNVHTNSMFKWYVRRQPAFSPHEHSLKITLWRAIHPPRLSKTNSTFSDGSITGLSLSQPNYGIRTHTHTHAQRPVYI